MKRKRNSHGGDRHSKQPRLTTTSVSPSDQSAPATPSNINHPVLRRLYPEVFTLRHYLLARLPTSSKNRRRRISQLGQNSIVPDGATTTTAADTDGGVDVELAHLLDSTLVGVPQRAVATEHREESEDTRTKDITTFSQQLSACASGSTFNPGYFLQTEVGYAMS